MTTKWAAVPGVRLANQFLSANLYCSASRV